MFRELFHTRSANSQRPAKSRTARLHIENLEVRDVPTAGFGFDPVVKELQLYATDGGDVCIFSIDNNGTTGTPISHWDDKLVVKWTHGGMTTTSKFDIDKPLQPGQVVPEGIIGRVFFMGGKGNDMCINNTSMIGHLFGRDGNDSIQGGIAGDYISGGKGSDWLYGGEGNDLMDGRGYYLGEKAGLEIATDHVFGQGGDDQISATDTKYSYLYGGNGDDYLWGATGKGVINFLDGGADNDYLQGGDASTPGYVTNILNDKKGYDRFVCGDKAINHVICNDGNLPLPGVDPAIAIDMINKSTGGIDVITMDKVGPLRNPDKYGLNLFNRVNTWDV